MATSGDIPSFELFRAYPLRARHSHSGYRNHSIIVLEQFYINMLRVHGRDGASSCTVYPHQSFISRYNMFWSARLQLRSLVGSLVTLGDGVRDSIVARLPDLGLEVHVDELVLLGLPLAVGVAVVDNLSRAGIADLDRGVGEGAVGCPLDVVAGALRDEERLGAADVALGVEALFDCVVHDLALGDRVACKSIWLVGVTRVRVGLGRRVRRRVKYVPLNRLVMERPAASIFWVSGTIIMAKNIVNGLIL